MVIIKNGISLKAHQLAMVPENDLTGCAQWNFLLGQGGVQSQRSNYDGVASKK